MIMGYMLTFKIRRLILEGVALGEDVSALLNVFERLNEYVININVDPEEEVALENLEAICEQRGPVSPAQGEVFKEWRAFVSFKSKRCE